MNLKRSSIMSSISALRVPLVSRKKGSRILLGILLSFVFCLGSLKINVLAYSDNMEVAYLFFGGMGFYAGVYQGCSCMVNDGQGTEKNKNSVYLYPTTGDPVHVVYYYNWGQMFPTLVDTGVTVSNGLINSNLINITYSGSTQFRLKFTQSANITPIYVGNYSSMPDDVRAMIQGETIESKVNYLITLESAMKTKVDSIFTRLGDTNTNLNTINSSIAVTNSNIATTNSLLNTNNTQLSYITSYSSSINGTLVDISDYFKSNNSTTNNNVSANNTQKTSFDNKASTLATFESTQGTNLDTNLQALDISSSDGLLINSSFVKSALWVNSMFDRLIVGSPFELVLVFCLSIGIAFAMIGKVR